MFRKVLIANRGEIAVRVAQTLQEMGVAAVAVFSDADRASLHVMRADEAHALEGLSPGETYLDIHKLIEAAQAHQADAIHPGYGFLSENAAFARACEAAGITFIGPSAEVIEAMGDKIVAKRRMAEAGVPVVPGWAGEGAAPLNEITRHAEEIGYPVLLKAAAGGGGKGMRIVHRPEELKPSLEAAQRESNSAFGDSRIFLEKYIGRPRHIEFQIFGDHHGNVVHVFERECSIQRRYQKIVEESPSAALTPELRQRMAEAAVRAAKALDYTNAGTVEFIVDPKGSFYFLEVNTRLQVEHPVTELVVQRDLVRTQLLVAAGEPLPFDQERLRQRGHAVECRVYAEDPERGFLPSTGRIERYVPPVGPNVRVDSGVVEGGRVTVHFDPMLAKVIVWGRSRNEAIERMRWALDRFVILGVSTNIEFLYNLVGHPAFRTGELHTHFLDVHEVEPRRPEGHQDAALVAALTVKGSTGGRPAEGAAEQPSGDSPGPWGGSQRWRNV